VLCVAHSGAGDRDHRLDGIGAGEHFGQVAPDAEAAYGEHVLQPFEQAPGGVGMLMLRPELPGQAFGGVQAFGRVGVGKDEGQAAVGPLPQLFWQVVPDVAPLVDLMKTST